MFIQQTNLPPHQPTKIYLRLKDKKSFILTLKEPVTLAELHDLIVKKTKIPSHDLIVMHQGKVIHFSHDSQPISFNNKSILHIINKKNLRNDIIEISVKFILRNDQKACLGETKFFAKFQESIKGFIHSKVVRVIEERTDEKICEEDLSLVLNGTVLKKQCNFHNYLIEDGSEIICMINNSEALQKSVNNVSTHKILVSRHQNYDEAKRQIKSEKDPKSSPPELSPHKRKSQVEKKSSLALSQQKSQEFVKLKTFESKHQMAEKQRLLNEALQNEKNEKKLKKRLKITSDLARRFEHQCEQEHDYQNYKAFDNKHQEKNLLEGVPDSQLQSHPKSQDHQINPNLQSDEKLQQAQRKAQGFKRLSVEVSNLEERDEGNIWEDPDSPIDVQYPPIQRRGPSLVEWDRTTASKIVGYRSERLQTSEIGHQEVNAYKQSFENPGDSHEKTKFEENPRGQQVSQNDLIIYGSLESEPKTIKDRIDQLGEKFTNLFYSQKIESDKKIESDNSAIQVEYPKIQEKGQPKLGDFLISDTFFGRPQHIVSQQLVNKFKEAINKININQIQDYGLDHKPQRMQENPQANVSNEANPQTTSPN